MRLKKCSLCKEEKDLSNYWKHKKAKDGLYAHCKACHTLQSRKTREKYRDDYRIRARINSSNWRKRNPEISKERNIKYRELNKEKYLENSKKRRNKLRKDILEKYGNKCTCCGEKQFEFLAIDHINNDGYLHRKKSYNDILGWIIKNNYPKDLQILCHNCNSAKSFYGICPHKILKIRRVRD